MHRRKFLAAAAVASAVPFSAAARAGPSAGIKVLETYLSNADQFPDGIWPAPGTPLSLQRAPQRAFDTRSVQVLDPDGTPLGYVPPASAQVLAALMDHGTGTSAIAGTSGTLSIFILPA